MKMKVRTKAKKKKCLLPMIQFTIMYSSAGAKGKSGSKVSTSRKFSGSKMTQTTLLKTSARMGVRKKTLQIKMASQRTIWMKTYV